MQALGIDSPDSISSPEAEETVMLAADESHECNKEPGCTSLSAVLEKEDVARILETTSVVNNKNEITVEAALLMQAALSCRQKLKNHELRLLGQLFIVATRGNVSGDESIMVVEVPQFPRQRPLTIARVPTQYTPSLVPTDRSWRLHESFCTDWVDLLPGTFNDKLITSLLNKKPELASDCMHYFHNKYMRLDAKASVSIQAFVDLNDAQFKIQKNE